MTTLLFANNIKTTLSAPITTTSTTITVSSGTGMPVPTTGQTFLITFVDATTGLLYEIASCTTRSGNTLTVVRGQEGTTPLNWNAGDTVAMFPTAGTMQNFAQISGAAFTGAVSATTLTASGLLTANSAYLPGGVLQIGANSPNANTIFKNDATLSTNYGANYYPIARGDGGTYALNITGNSGTATLATTATTANALNTSNNYTVQNLQALNGVQINGGGLNVNSGNSNLYTDVVASINTGNFYVGGSSGTYAVYNKLGYLQRNGGAAEYIVTDNNGTYNININGNSNTANSATNATNATNASYSTTQGIGNQSTLIATTAFANPGSSLAQSGYTRLPNGLIIQTLAYGDFSWENNVNRVFSLPLNFPNAPFVVMVSTSNTDYACPVNAFFVSNSQVAVCINTSGFSSAQTFNLIAIGY
jgi:hypothetical protein